MWTRGKDGQGGFQYSLYSPSGAHVETVGGFTTHTEADRAAERAQRLRCGFDQPCDTLRYLRALEADNHMTDEDPLYAADRERTEHVAALAVCRFKFTHEAGGKLFLDIETFTSLTGGGFAIYE